MDRREALRNVAFLMGGTVIGAQAFLIGCQSKKEEAGKNSSSLFKQDDIALMDEIGETIIPTTDTPGAKAAQIGSFMTIMVQDCYDDKSREAFRAGLNKIHENFHQEFGHSFIAGKPEERISYLLKLEEEWGEYNSTKKEDDPEHYFRMLKELTLLGYFTSEVGSTQALKYIQVPGRYEACIPYEANDKAWAVG